MNKNTLIAFIGMIIVAAGFFFLHSTPKTTTNSHTFQSSTRSIPANSQMNHADTSKFPDPSKTPGDIIQGATKDQICVGGYTKTVRNVNTAEKRQVYQEYNLSYPQARGAYEVDHFIPLELGGSNDIKNLWPEPANPTPGFHQKDMAENYLHAQVCNGSETLQDAQSQIQTNWFAVYEKIPNKSQNGF